MGPQKTGPSTPDTIINLFYSPTDAQVNYLKNSFKIYIKIDIKTASTYFGAVTPSSGSALLVLAEVTVVKIKNGKAIPLQAWTGPEGSKRLRLPDFKTIGTVVSPTHRPPLLPENIPGTHFC
jgi:hypothetical protein